MDTSFCEMCFSTGDIEIYDSEREENVIRVCEFCNGMGFTKYHNSLSYIKGNPQKAMQAAIDAIEKKALKR